MFYTCIVKINNILHCHVNKRQNIFHSTQLTLLSIDKKLFIEEKKPHANMCAVLELLDVPLFFFFVA